MMPTRHSVDLAMAVLLGWGSSCAKHLHVSGTYRESVVAPCKKYLKGQLSLVGRLPSGKAHAGVRSWEAI